MDPIASKPRLLSALKLRVLYVSFTINSGWWLIKYNSYCITRVYVESINRYFAEEHPQGQEIAIDKGDNQLLENDYRYIIGMETP